MSLKHFQLLDFDVFDNSIVKRDFMKVCHQQGAQLNDQDQNIKFVFAENNNYHQIGNAYLEYDITVQDPAAVFDNNSRIRLTNNGLAYVFQEAVLATTSGSNLKHNKFVGQVSTTLRVLTSKDGHLLLQFDNIIESNTNADFDSTSLKKMLIDNQATDADKGKSKAQLPLEHIIGFCKTFKKVTKNLGFELTFKTVNLPNIIYKAIADGTQINVAINSLYLFVPILLPSTETQFMFNESIQNNYRMFFDEFYTERRVVRDQIYQIDIGSAQSVNSPKCLIFAHQTAARSDTPKKRTNISVFDHLDVRKYFIEIDVVRYPRDGVLKD